MARPRKSKTAQPATQEILVPREEQPYAVPENWQWVRLGGITTIVGGGTPSSCVSEYYANGTIPWISPADLSGFCDIYISYGKKMITDLGLNNSSAKILPAGTVCLSSRAPIGYVAIAKNPLCTNQGFKNFLPAKSYHSHFLYWYLKKSKKDLESYASGTTFLEISGARAAQIKFPLPPLAEQERIVARIERLFSCLDKAREKVEGVIKRAAVRKAAILHKAFTGELTAQWREAHGIGLDSWQSMSLQNICKSIFDGDHMPPPKTAQGIPFIVISNIRTGKICFSNTYFVSEQYYSNLTETRRPSRGDILYSVVGSFGIPAIVETDRKFCFQRHIALLRPSNIVLSRFLWYQLQESTIYNKVANLATGTAQLTVTIKKLRSVCCLIPILREQEEIVRILDELLEKERGVQEAAGRVVERIERIRQTILARAFRGELGTNDPTEPPSPLPE